MLNVRVIPCLLLRDLGLVKTIKFKDPTYLGDPRNTIKIFNEKEVDELVLLDITATPSRSEPNYDLLEEITSECFMPLAYGGGIKDLDQIEKILKLGVEKVCINTQAYDNYNLIKDASKCFGSQSIVVSIDVKKNFWKEYRVYTKCGWHCTNIDPIEHASRVEQLGAGEILLNSIDKDGTMDGYDLELIKRVSSKVDIPVIACGGACSVEDLGKAIKQGGASAVAAGSLFVFYGKHRAVLINFPVRYILEGALT